jgi:hypothetical protein
MKRGFLFIIMSLFIGTHTTPSLQGWHQHSSS